jgi:ATP-dependent Clp endopeptidase proteolytic subunit ClpP
MKKLFIVLALLIAVPIAADIVFETPNDNIDVEENKQIPKIPFKVKKIKVNPDNVIKLEGFVGQHTENVIPEIMEKSRRGKNLYIFINSPGGSVFSGGQIITAMENSPSDIYTVCIEYCASMAANIHQHGKKRYMFNRSVLMFHRASARIGGQLPHIRARLDMFEKLSRDEANYIADRIKMPLEKFQYLMLQELWVDAEQAYEMNMVDEIVNIKFTDLSETFFKIYNFNKEYQEELPWQF